MDPLARRLRSAGVPTTHDFQQHHQEKSPRDVGASEGPTPTGGNPVDAQPTVSDRAEALERAENGDRLALAMLLSQPDAPPAAEVLDAAAAKEVASFLLTARESALEAAKKIPLNGHLALHRKLNELVNTIDDIGAVLAERYER